MSLLKYKTRNQISPQGMPKVYFCAHKADFCFFEEISKDILEKHNCAVFYEEEKSSRDDDFYSKLEDMQLFVMPVTEKLLTTDNEGMRDFAFAMKQNIPVLPLMMEEELSVLFNKKCGSIQFLSKFNKDETAISFEEKFETFLSKVLIGDELAKKIRDAFDAYIFLSYRKIDRAHAQKLMKLIHKNEFCRDIAIWYDEYLVPGENFNNSIKEAFEKSGLFVLAVTPNVIAKVMDKNGNMVDNYVKSVEYKMFKDRNEECKKLGKEKMPLIPAEMVETDKDKLNSEFSGLPCCVNYQDEGELSQALKTALEKIAIKENDGSAEHNFYIGLAYLNGIDVEKNADRALSLITASGEDGLIEAIDQLITMYENGIGVERNYITAINWREKKIEALQKKYRSLPNNETEDELFWAYINCSDAYSATGNFEKAFEKIVDARNHCADVKVRCDNTYRNLSMCHERLGLIFLDLGKNQKALEAFLECHHLRKVMAEECKTILAKQDFAIILNELGDTYTALGMAEEALKKYEESFLLSCSTETENENSIAFFALKLGDIYLSLGRVDEAFEKCSFALKTAKDAFEVTKDITSKRFVYLALSKVGNIYLSKGQIEKALDMRKETYEIAKSIVEESPTCQAKRDLAVCLEELGDIYKFISKNQADLEAAAELYIESYEITKSIFEELQTTKSMRDMGNSLNKIGNIYMGMGKHQDALESYKESYTIFKIIVETTETIEAKLNLSRALLNIGNVYAQLESPIEALKKYMDCYHIRKSIAEETKTAEAQRNLSMVLLNLGYLYENMGMHDEALEKLSESYEIDKALVEKTDSMESKRRLAMNASHIGSVLYSKGQNRKAMEKCVESYTLFKFIADKTQSAEAYLDLAVSYSKIAFGVDGKEKNILLKEAIKIIDMLIEANPNIVAYKEYRATMIKAMIQ